MFSISSLDALVSEFNSTGNPSKYLASKLEERAHFAHKNEQNDEKQHRGIAWTQVCATESDIEVSETEKAQRPSMKERDSSLDSDVVVELLPVVKSENVFGREEEKEQLLSQLLAPNEGAAQVSVILVTGIGGIGKTTLARLVYEDQKVQDHFELKAWVKIGGQKHKQKQKQLCDIARKLLKSATGTICPLNSRSELDEMVFDALLSQRSLIVLDDVEAMDVEEWQHMNKSWFGFVGLGSKVLITTCKSQVPGIDASITFELGNLSSDAGWLLYSSLSLNTPAPQQLAAGRCKGQPLSLKLLGSLIAFEGISSPDLMERITPFLDVSIVLSISVLSLRNELFNCFAYCGIFPCGYVLEKKKLIKMWIADGVVKPGTKSMEDIGEDYFHQLLCRSFFTDITCNEYDDIVQARMPRDIHKVAQEIAALVFKGKVGYAFHVDENSVRLSVALPFEEVYSPRNLHTMVSMPAKHLKNPSSNRFFAEFKRLRSLDLSRSGIRSLSNHICKLRKLRYLNLSHTLLTKLPKCFTALACLQTLDLSGCYFLRLLPKKLSSLSQLRHLDLSQCNSLNYMPFGIGRLNSLVTMTLYVLGERDSNGAALGELHKLNELRGVLHIRNLENVEISEAKAADLKSKKLHHLGLSWSHKVDECHTVLEWLQPNPELRVLDLTGYGAYGFPSWMQNLNNLVKLFINDCKCTKLPTLGKLPTLKELHLKELINIRSIGQEFYGDSDGEGEVFPSLEKLKLHDMPNLNHWSNAVIAQGSNHSSERVFPSLKKLSIQGCPELQSLPSLPYVTELVVWRSHSKILPLLTRIRSLSSIVINNMNVKESLGSLSSLNSVKKLIVVHSTDLDALESSHVNKLTSLEYLRILHCLKLEHIEFSNLGSLQKLNIVDCQKLNKIDLPYSFTLKELVIEDCPQITSIGIKAYNGSIIRKLIVRNCPQFTLSPQSMRKLQGLEFLFITGCRQMEE